MLTDATLTAAFETVTGRPGTPVERSRYAPATLLSYAPIISRFGERLARKGRALPADADEVCAYLDEIACSGLAPQTVRKVAAALSVAHRHRGAAFNWNALRETLHRVARFSWHAPRQARPLLAEELKAILEMLVPTRHIDARDAALLTLGWAAMLRRAELVGLDWHRRGGGGGFARLENGGIVVLLAKSKTKQAGIERIHVGPADMPAAIGALKTWVELSKARPGEPLFRSVRGREAGERLPDRQVSRILKARVSELALGLGRLPDETAEIARYTSGHSLRAGCITAMALAGVPEHEIRRRSRHASADMVARYVRVAQQWQDSGLRAVGF